MSHTHTKPTIVDQGSRPGSYDPPQADALIDDPRYGRLYITQGFGGMDTLEGGKHRWRHGIVLRVSPDTTIEQAREIDPMDPAAEIIEWNGDVIDRYVCYVARHPD